MWFLLPVSGLTGIPTIGKNVLLVGILIFAVPGIVTPLLRPAKL